MFISSSVVPFSSCLQSFPASGSFQMSQLFAWGSESIGVLASSSVLQMNIQDWFPLGLTDLISLQSRGLSRVFPNTTVQKHHLFSTQLSLWSNSHSYMTTGKTIALARWTFVSKVTFYPNLSQILFGVVTISCVVLMKRTPFHYRSHGGQIFSFDVACISTWQINAFT